MDDVIINVTIPVSMSNLLQGDGYNLLAKMGDVSKDGWSFKPSVDKKAMKVKLTDEGCTSNIAKVVENNNLTIAIDGGETDKKGENKKKKRQKEN